MRFVWNAQHRVNRDLQRQEWSSAWTYTLAAFQQANANAANQVEMVVGLNEEPVYLTVSIRFSNTSTSVTANVGIGLDSTSVISRYCYVLRNASWIANVASPTQAVFSHFVGIGYHRLVWLEQSTATGTTTWATSAVGLFAEGLTGTIRA
jgi:hypothetical protein